MSAKSDLGNTISSHLAETLRLIGDVSAWMTNDNPSEEELKKLLEDVKRANRALKGGE